MNRSEQFDILEYITNKEIGFLKSKGEDYASEEDVLKNFKTVSLMCKLLNVDVKTTNGTNLFYIILKLQRLCNLICNDKIPKNESVLDTIVDFRNYLFLLMCNLQEKQKEVE